MKTQQYGKKIILFDKCEQIKRIHGAWGGKNILY